VFFRHVLMFVAFEYFSAPDASTSIMPGLGLGPGVVAGCISEGSLRSSLQRLGLSCWVPDVPLMMAFAASGDRGARFAAGELSGGGSSRFHSALPSITVSLRRFARVYARVQGLDP